MYQYTQYNHFQEEYNVEEVTLPGFDRAVLAPDTQWSGQRLFLKKGNVVVYLSYSGHQDLTGRPELLEELTAFQN